MQSAEPGGHTIAGHNLGPDGRLQISDPKALHLLANPTRLRIVDHLYATQHALTATDLTRVVPIRPSAMSYHLRALEGLGIIERVAADTDRRERPWRAVAEGYSLVASDSSDAQAHAWLIDSRLEPMRQRMSEQLAIRAAAEPASRDDPYMVLATGDLWLTETEARSAVAELEALWQRYERLSQQRGPTTHTSLRYMWSLLPDAPTGRN